MADSMPITPEQAQVLLESINNLKTGAMIFIGLMVVVIVAYMLISKILTWKRDKLLSEQKNARVEAQVAALTAISKNMKDMTEDLAKLRINSQHSFDAQKQHGEAMLTAQQSVNSQLDMMNKKIKGIIPDIDASKIIKVYFTTIIRREVSYLVEAQIIENGFAESADFIKRRLKSNIGDILDRCQNELRELKLPISVRSIFVTYTDDDGERYQICDMIWDKIMPILAKGGDKKKNIEEAKLFITNIVNDYITPVMKELTETPTDKFQSALERNKSTVGDGSTFKANKTPSGDSAIKTFKTPLPQ